MAEITFPLSLSIVPANQIRSRFGLSLPSSSFPSSSSSSTRLSIKFVQRSPLQRENSKSKVPELPEPLNSGNSGAAENAAETWSFLLNLPAFCFLDPLLHQVKHLI
jgi:hypothetical protein